MRTLIPHLFTGLRLIAGPFVIWALIQQQNTFAFWLVCFAGWSDWLDGATARYFNCESDFGRLFDPIADKVFVICICIGLMYVQFLPTWLVVTIVVRDVLIILGGLWIKKHRRDYKLSPLYISKINTFAQMSLAGWLLMNPLLPKLAFYPLFSESLIYVTLVTTLLSGAAYGKIFVKLYRAS